MKHIISLSYSGSQNNFESVIRCGQTEYRLSHLGADYNSEVFASLVKSFDQSDNIICLSGLLPPLRVKSKLYFHSHSEELKNSIQHAQVYVGALCRETLGAWTLGHILEHFPEMLVNKRIGFHSGALDYALVAKMQEHTHRFSFFDPKLFTNVPKALESIEALERFVGATMPLISRKKLSKSMNYNATFEKVDPALFRGVETVITRSAILDRMDLEHLRDKNVIVDSLRPSLIKRLGDAGVRSTVHLLPDIEYAKQDPRINFPIFEALVAQEVCPSEALSKESVVDWIAKHDYKPKPNILNPVRSKRHVRRFAFIIHPLSLADVFRHPVLRPLSSVAMKNKNIFERTISHIPGICYGKLTGVKSTHHGEEVEGLIYTIFDTPKQLMRLPPEVVYKKLNKICEQAARDGAEIIGLGAYTKIAGDSGVTVNKMSPIPVTTGNSLSASATLWAARVAMQKMWDGVRVSRANSRHDIKVMVIGATGSIGAAAAKLLAHYVDELVLSARTVDKILSLKAEIDSLGLKCKVSVTTESNRYASSCDLIITSTSTHDKSVFDIQRVKPGCVVCDVSRPLNVSKEDVLSRPDVLVVESGEITLPGQNLHLNCDIGTPDGVVYACLAETALLALEGRLEAFTLSRNVEFDKVRQIYDMAKKHGAKLGAIRGHFGDITDQEIQLCREHALKSMKNWRPDE